VGFLLIKKERRLLHKMTLQHYLQNLFHLFYLSPVQFIAAIFILVAFIAVISLAAKSLFGAGDVEGRNRGAKDRGGKDRGGRNGVVRNGITRNDDLLDTPFEAKSYNATQAATIQRLKAENYELRSELKKRDAEFELLSKKAAKLHTENVLLRAANRRLNGEVERLRAGKEMERMGAGELKAGQKEEVERMEAGQKEADQVTGQKGAGQKKEAARP